MSDYLEKLIENYEQDLMGNIYTYGFSNGDTIRFEIKKVIVKKTGPGLSQAKIATKYGASKVCAPQNMGLYERRSRFLNYTH